MAELRRRLAERQGVTEVTCALAVGVLAFLAFPHMRESAVGGATEGVMRGVWAGAAVALIPLPGTPRWSAPAVTAAASLLAATFLALSNASAQPVWLLVGVGVAVAVAGLVSTLAVAGRRRLAEVLAVGVVVSGLLIFAGALPGEYAARSASLRRYVSVEPADEAYDLDAKIYLKTLYLLERGVPYYEAFSEAFEKDIRNEGPPASAFSYRQPWLPVALAAVPGRPGHMAWWTFVLAAAATAVAGYILARGFVMPGAALLGPMWFTAYIGRAAHAGGFLFTEFWGGFAAVFAIALMARRRWTAAAVAVIAAVALRELMAYLLLVFLATALASEERREPLRGLVTAFVGSAVVLGLHFYRAPVTAGVADISAWLHGGIVPLLAAVRFSNDHMTVGVYPYLALVLALAGAWLTRESRQRALLVAAVAVPLILLATVSAGVWGYYWGPILMVPVLMIAPTALNRVWPAVAPAPDSRHHVRHPEKDSR